MEKLDLKKDLKHLYVPSAKKVELVECRPEFHHGRWRHRSGPGSGHLAALRRGYAGSLWGSVHAQVHRQAAQAGPGGLPGDGPRRAVVGGGWHLRHPQAGNWKYTVMIMQPDLVTPDCSPRRSPAAQEKRRPAGLCPPAVGELPRGARGPDHAYRPLCGRTGHRRQMQAFMQANGLQDLSPGRKTPRDLHGRPAPRRPGEAEDRPAPPCEKGIDITNMTDRLLTLPHRPAPALCIVNGIPRPGRVANRPELVQRICLRLGTGAAALPISVKAAVPPRQSIGASPRRAA